MNDDLLDNWAGVIATGLIGYRCALPVFLYLADCIARHTRSLDAGMSKCFTPTSASALAIAFITAGIAPTTPASPAPLAPSGLRLVGTGLLWMMMSHMSSARGMA